MRFADAPGWLMSEESSRDVLVALYIRDVLDVRPPSGLPRLEPRIGAAEHARTMREQRVLEIQWEHWWQTVVEPRTHPSPVPLTLLPLRHGGIAVPQTGSEELTAAVMANRNEAERWVDRALSVRSEAGLERVQRQDGMALTRLVAEREREIGRRARSFRLRIEILPFDEPGLWWIGDSAVAVSETLRDDAAAFAEFMRPVIAHVA